MQNLLPQSDQDSGQSLTQPLTQQPIVGYRIPNPVQLQFQNSQFPIFQQNISDKEQNDIAAVFIDLDLLFLKLGVHKKASAKLYKDKKRESSQEIGDIKIGSKLIYAKCFIKIRYNQEISGILENCFINSFNDEMLCEKLLGPRSDTISDAMMGIKYQEIKDQLNKIRQILR